MSCIYEKIKKYLLDREDGATAIEYGLLIALIVVVSIGLVVVLGEHIAYWFCIATGLGGEATNCVPPGSIPPEPLP